MSDVIVLGSSTEEEQEVIPQQLFETPSPVLDGRHSFTLSSGNNSPVYKKPRNSSLDRSSEDQGSDVAFLRRHINTLQRSHTAEMSQLRNMVGDLQFQLDDHEFSERKLARVELERDGLKTLLSGTTKEVERLAQDNTALKVEIAELREISSKRESVLDELPGHSSHPTPGDDSSCDDVDLRSRVRILEQELETKTRSLEELEKSQVRDRNLQEKVVSLEQKLSRSQTYLEGAMQAQADNSEIAQRGKMWQDAVKSMFDNCSSTKHFIEEVNNLRDSVRRGVSIETSLNIRLNEASMETEELKAKLLQVPRLQGRIDTLCLDLQDTRTKLAEQERLRISLARIVESYESSEISPPELIQHSSNLADGDRDDLSASLQSALNQNTGLSKKLEKALTEIDMLKCRLGRGEYSTQMTKVLHLKRPAKSVEPTQSIASMKAELEELKKGKDRLVEVYGDVTNQFKNMYSQLTGFTVDLIEKRKYRVKSMYFEDPADELVFGVEKKGTSIALLLDRCKIRGNLLQDAILHMRKRGSRGDIISCDELNFPDFFSQLTLDLIRFHFSDN